MEYPNIDIYGSNNNLSSTIQIKTLKENTSYVLGKKKVYSGFEKYINQVVDYHLVGINHNPDNICVEFGLYNNSNMAIEFDKKTKKNPLFSIVSIFDEHSCPLIFTNIDIETYKYKEYTDENKITVTIPVKNTHIVFDSSKYYGGLTLDNNNDVPSSSQYLKINIWDIVITDSPIYIDEEADDSTSELFSDLSINIVPKTLVHTSITDDNLMEKILYDLTKTPLNKLNELLNATVGSCFNINIKSSNSEKLDFTILENKYGNVAKDIFPFINTEIELDENNRFHNNKLIQNMLSKDVCYWIINECEKQKKWSDSPYVNYKEYLNIETFPAIMNFVLYISGMWLSEIRKLYDIDTININIRDIFLAKYIKSDNNNFLVRNKDDTFLTLNVQLNSEVDYKGGEITIDNSKIQTKQGDMLVYNGKKMRTNGMVSDGVKYMLVFFTDIML